VRRGLNRVTLIGELGRDPEMRYTPSGTPVTTFSLAASRSWTTPDGERREAIEWFLIVAWRTLAETCARELRCGDRAFVEGRLQTRSWSEDDGRLHQRVEVVAHEMVPVGDAGDVPVPGTQGSSEEDDTSVG